MKRISLLLIALFANGLLQAQIISIPDALFLNTLVSVPCADLDGDGIYESDVDVDNDFQIQLSEAQAVIGLNLGSRQISSLRGLENFSNIELLDITYNQLDTIDLTSLSLLSTVNFSFNPVVSLNLNNLGNLENVYGLNTTITSFNFVGLNNLKRLQLDSNPITSFTAAAYPNIRILSFSSTFLDSLIITNLDSLEEIYCDHSLLEFLRLDSLPNLHFLYCSINNLDSLDLSGVTSLRDVYCEMNQMTYLNVNGLNQLRNFSCAINNLSQLDVSGLDSLRELSCLENQIEVLDIQGLTSLTYLDVTDNNLTQFDARSIQSLQYLYLNGNDLQSLFLKNNSEEGYVTFSNNPNLTFICCDSVEIADMQQLAIQDGLFNCTISSFCSLLPDSSQYTLSIQAYFDINNDGCDSLDQVFPFFPMIIANNNVGSVNRVITNAQGGINLNPPTGDYAVFPALVHPTYFTFSPDTLSISFPGFSDNVADTFCISSATPAADLLSFIMPLSPLRPGFEATYRIGYGNLGNQFEDCTLKFIYDTVYLDTVSFSTPPDTVIGDTLIWYFQQLAPLQTGTIFCSFLANSPQDLYPLNGGDTLAFSTVVMGSQQDSTPADNYFSFLQEVVSSYDPNDKTCIEGPTIAPDEVGGYLHYLIRFENTGNYFAEDVIINDQIDTALYDLSTLEVLDVSHSLSTNITEGGLVSFFFNNIMLPYVYPASTGYVLFRIKSKSNLVLGDTLRNQASIFFDFNLPIITNIAQTVVWETPSAIITHENRESSFTIFPNPSSDILSIQTDESIEYLEVIDLQGNIILVARGQFEHLDISTLTEGVYYLRIKSELGIGLCKFLKY